MNILLLAPYCSGSHAAWARGYVQHSSHRVHLLSLQGRFWKWRMHGGAVTLARRFRAADFEPELLLATDMLDLTTFLALTRPATASLPAAVYFHENQLSYPWSPQDRDVARRRDKHYGFINYVSALAADAVLFNSPYHRRSFLAELPRLLKHFPDYNELASVKQVEAKSEVLPLGLHLARFDRHRPAQPHRARPLILWNHRWEYDKNPGQFFEALRLLAGRGLDFEVAILGQNFRRQPEEFTAARRQLGERIVQFGYVPDFAAYAAWLWQADLLPVTSYQDFFGASLVQALYCDCYPLLPRRLAYPELVPQPEYFYTDFEELVARLATAIEDIEAVRAHSLRLLAARYDWQHIAPQYDARLAQLA